MTVEPTWADLQAAVGQDFASGESVAGEVVDASGIRRFCEVVELGCPVHWDERAARDLGYPGLVLPISAYSTTYTSPPIWSPGAPTRWPEKGVHSLYQPPLQQGNARPLPMPRTQFAFATDIEIEAHRPVCVGDRLIRSGHRLIAVNLRETSVGQGAFVTTESVIHNQRGELVATLRHGGYRYNAHTPESLAEYRRTHPAPAPREIAPMVREIPVASEPRLDWRDSLRWRDVMEGAPVPEVSVHLSIQRLVIAAGANRDFNAVHHDTVLTQRTGVDEVYANNGLIQAIWERTVREYIGSAGHIRKIGPFRMRAFNRAGCTITTRGTVVRRYQANGERLVELSLWSENDDGVSVGPGPVVVKLEE